MSRVLVIGVGNAGRRDDGVGLEVARRLRERVGRGVEICARSGEAARLLESWEGADLVFLVDAVRSGQEPGKIHRFAAHAHELPAAHFSCSTHGFGPAQAVELGRALGRLPRRLIAYGIEAGDLQVGNGLSPEVARAAGEVAGRIAAECAAFERG